MGQDDQLGASLAHVVLGCISARGLGHLSGKSFSEPGMHANLFIHSVLGFLRYQSGIFNNDFAAAYTISYKASRYLPLPCLMADLYSSNQNLSVIHLVSGLIPFAMMLTGKDNPHLGNMVIAINIISLCHYSMQHNNENGWYTAAAGILAYFVAGGHMGKEGGIPAPILYPLSLALMEFFAFKLYAGWRYAAATPPGGRH